MNNGLKLKRTRQVQGVRLVVHVARSDMESVLGETVRDAWEGKQEQDH